jgi:hypothetical protein
MSAGDRGPPTDGHGERANTRLQRRAAHQEPSGAKAHAGGARTMTDLTAGGCRSSKTCGAIKFQRASQFCTNRASHHPPKILHEFCPPSDRPQTREIRSETSVSERECRYHFGHRAARYGRGFWQSLATLRYRSVTHFSNIYRNNTM